MTALQRTWNFVSAFVLLDLANTVSFAVEHKPQTSWSDLKSISTTAVLRVGAIVNDSERYVAYVARHRYRSLSLATRSAAQP